MTMRTTLIAALFASTALIGACNNDRTATESASQPATSGSSAATASSAATVTPEELGELGAKIEKQPDRAGELLSAKGLDEKSFEQEIRKVTENPEASKRYAEAYKKAKA